jgi:hypothetical protein
MADSGGFALAAILECERYSRSAGIRYLCQDLFKILQILPFYSQYIYSLLMFVVKNRSLFKLNSVINGFSTRYDDFHLPSANLKLFQKGVFYSGIETFHRLSKNYHMMRSNSDWL